jgi:ornithine carbamoyltransferase
MTRHFLRDDDLSPAEQREVLELAWQLKADRFSIRPLAGPKAVAILFDKPTLRTQVSFATAVIELGGYPLVVDGNLAQVGVRESVYDVTSVLTRQVSAIVWRTYGQQRIEEMAACATVPVVNALTDQFHPCQVLADILTVAEHLGGVDALAGTTLAYVGDGSFNMANSLLLGGTTAGMHVRIGAPTAYQPAADMVAAATQIAASTGGSVQVVDNLDAAVAGADVVVTDTWVSMGQQQEAAEREAQFLSFQVTTETMVAAGPNAIFLHCLPAYRGKEVTADVIDGPASRVWDEAENRLHTQKAILTWLLERV